MKILLFLILIIVALLLIFNRGPPRIDYNFSANDIISPADGVIKYIKDVELSSFGLKPETTSKKYKMIHIFIGLSNIHTQVYPSDGLILKAEYSPTGVFKDARGDTNQNEKLDTYLNNGIIIRQIAGILARRIEAYDPVGTNVVRGGELGRITLGSGCEIFLPDNYRISNEIIAGCNFKVGKTIIANKSV